MLSALVFAFIFTTFVNLIHNKALTVKTNANLTLTLEIRNPWSLTTF